MISCDQSRYQENTSNLEYAFLKNISSVNPKIKGLWKSVGNGYFLDARQDSILLYSYTKNFCYKEKNDYMERLLNSESQFNKQGDTISVFLTDYGDRTADLQGKRIFTLVEALPKDCMNFDEMQGMKPRKLFNLWLETMKENYAFSHERNMDWDSIDTIYGNKITDETTSEELFQLIGKAVTQTKDHHTKIIGKDGRMLQYRVTPSAEIVIDSFNNQSIEKDLNHFFNSYFKYNYKNISDTLLLGKGKKVVNDKIEWGSLNEKIGYINIHSFTGFGKGITRKQQIDSISLHMDNVIDSLIGKEAIIVDISFNFGGFDASGLTIAGYFTNEIVHGYTRQVYSNGGFFNESEVRIVPAENVNYTKPVYVLMTDVSRSAAEGFAMLMGALPNVKLVGTNTLGILSGMLGKSIGEYYSTSSNQRLLTSEGEFYEVLGVEPDIRLNVFSGNNVFNGHKWAVRQLIKIIEENEKSQQR